MKYPKKPATINKTRKIHRGQEWRKHPKDIYSLNPCLQDIEEFLISIHA